jgi:hypothetical protein
MLALSIFFQFYLSFIFQLIQELKLYKKIIFIFSLIAFYVFFYGITDTADWEMYKDFFLYEEIEIDFLFRYLSLLTIALGYSFDELYQFHILIYGYFLVKFISRFTQNILLVLGFYVFVAYVPLANQIRYYLALSFFLNGLYLFYFNEKKKSYLFFILSLLSHSSMLILFSFLLIEKRFGFSEYIKKCLLLSLIIFVGYNFIVSFGLLDFLGKFKIYIVSDELVSSFAGGVFNELPFIITLTTLYFWLQKVIDKMPQILEDKIFVFLYKLTFFSIIFVPISFNLQVLGHRYVQAFFIVWLCLFVYTVHFINYKKTTIECFIVLAIYMVFLVYYSYFFSQVVIGNESGYYSEFIKSYNSIEYLPDI